jgi:hypothetical protein
MLDHIRHVGVGSVNTRGAEPFIQHPPRGTRHRDPLGQELSRAHAGHRFHRVARSYGIKPITGVELRAQYQAGTQRGACGRL